MDDLDKEIAELDSRTAALRDAHTTSPGDAADTAEAALAELELAVELLRKCRETATGDAGEERSHRRHDNERAVLRSVFAELSLPVLLLDRGGYIRRGNGAAAERLGSSPGYLAGKPFSVFVDLRRRAAMRSRFAAVLRNGETVSFESRLAGQGRDEDVHLTLARHEISTEAEPLVSVVMSVPFNGGPQEPAPLDPEVEDQVVVLAARRLDVLTRMTRLLLRSTGANAAADRPALGEAARLLAGSYAEWVLIDVCDRPGVPETARRVAVAGPDGDPRNALVGSPALLEAAVPLEVLSTGHSLLRRLIDDETLLGRTPDGAAVLGVLGAGSLACVPLRGSRGVRGSLTLVRRSDRGGFRLADLGLLEEIGEHIGLALPAPGE